MCFHSFRNFSTKCSHGERRCLVSFRDKQNDLPQVFPSLKENFISKIIQCTWNYLWNRWLAKFYSVNGFRRMYCDWIVTAVELKKSFWWIRWFFYFIVCLSHNTGMYCDWIVTAVELKKSFWWIRWFFYFIVCLSHNTGRKLKCVSIRFLYSSHA